MSRQRKERRQTEEDKAAPDLTPMIDVTFQLLIFFILCTRFRVDENNMRADLPKTDGMLDKPSPPKEQVTIYCVWDDGAQANQYVIAIDARGRRTVENSYATLEQLVIFPADSAVQIREKKAKYALVCNSLVDAVEGYIDRSGAKIEKVEISFAKDPTVGARSGTAPWMFVSTALDAATIVNQHRAAQDKPQLPLMFKYSDSLGVYDR
ncbi:MAG: biopolymer transporter ExbD [Planctomycetes bacterium]|nr:biopolymer transporter ExbD [Planctomycetota bacterium]